MQPFPKVPKGIVVHHGDVVVYIYDVELNGEGIMKQRITDTIALILDRH